MPTLPFFLLCPGVVGRYAGYLIRCATYSIYRMVLSPVLPLKDVPNMAVLPYAVLPDVVLPKEALEEGQALVDCKVPALPLDEVLKVDVPSVDRLVEDDTVVVT
jgi:hypothetical protein